MVEDHLENISELLRNAYQAFNDLYQKHSAVIDEETSLKLKAAEDSAQSMDHDELRQLLLAIYSESKRNLEE